MIRARGDNAEPFCFAPATCYRQAMTKMLSRMLSCLKTLPAPMALLARCLIAACCLAPAGALADKIKHPTAIFAGLDKITGRIIAFDVAIDETVQFGSLQITPRACYTRPPTEAPLTIGFTEVDEVSSTNEYKRIFSGWMFADSPGLHGIEHPVYDVWLTDCKGGTEVIHEVIAEAPQEDLSQPVPKPGTRPRAARPVTPGAPADTAGVTPQPAQLPPASAAPPQLRGATISGAPLPPPTVLPGSPGGQPLPAQQFQPPPQQRANPNALIPPADIGSPPARRSPSQTYYPAASNPGRGPDQFGN